MFKQTLIPGFPEGAIRVGAALSVVEKDGRVTYFVGGDNYFSHALRDKSARRYALAMGLAHCAAARFEPARDVEMGGLLAGLPALCANGLLSGLAKHLKLPRGRRQNRIQRGQTSSKALRPCKR